MGDAELEGILAQEQMLKETARIEHEETCREEHDRILDEIRTERDTQLEAVRVQSIEDQLEVMEEAKQELVVMQAQLEQQLKNIREQHYDEIEKIMRKCEGG